MTHKKTILFLFGLLIHFIANASLINIGLYNSYKIKKIIFSVTNGTYSVFTIKGQLITLQKGDEIFATLENNDSIKLIQGKNIIGVFRNIDFIAQNKNCRFTIQPIEPRLKERTYDDNLLLKKNIYFNQLLLINNVNLSNYIAGVVQAEVGTSPPYEYFKLQAIICRTYALKNIHRHKDYGFNLCDGVHCQAYHGRATDNEIIKAVNATKNIVAVDSNINYIMAAFSSNCGGETANSQDVWNRRLYYLQSVKDTFCIHSRHARWQKTISLAQWDTYLKKHLICTNDSTKNIACFYNYTNPDRQPFFTCDSCKLDFNQMREDFHLRSAYLNIKKIGDNIIFNGRGFGHGVGLCQEGAIAMARDGYKYYVILQHYFRGVFLININAIDLFKEK